jgi:hypothetical protein
MANAGGKLVFKVVSIAVGIPVGIAVRKGIEKAWLVARPENPPRTADDPDVGWGDALGWATLSAVGVAAGQLVRSKGAATLYRGLTGSPPPAKKSANDPAKDATKAGVKAAVA